MRSGYNSIQSILVLFILLLPAFVPAQSNEKETLVVIGTPKGDITLMLYDDTPLHRDNFLRLAGEGFFDSTLFHRVIRNFMIQGGDPDSKHAAAGVELGEGGPGYDLPSEINAGHFHKRGVLAAAREDDKVNPKRLSSGSQFYIVQGKVYSQQDLDKIEKEQNSLTKQRIFVGIMDNPANLSIRNQFFSPDAKKDSVHFRFLLDTLNKMIDREYVLIPEFKLSEEQRRVYTTIGGTPQLDGKYTVFGEVVRGMEIVDAIASEKTDKNDRPLNDVRMFVKIITRKKSNP
ncbi:MAG: peptidyl-prolyl cis-trans isomerase B (cyclophilin B) [Bacteroidetes bacterium]|nr:MAG: peptidyl-prolyl cis-trans isomerase B (cyclophilin B) [Bacteroidota bacterium]